MKEPKLTKKELAAQSRELEEQLTRLKNRLNGQAFKKTKHGYRLDQLSEGAQQLSGRVSELELQLVSLSEAQKELSEKWQQLGKDTDTLKKNEPREPGGKKRIKEQLAKLKTSVAELSELQQQIGNTLGEMQSAVGRAGNARDDLKLETDELRTQVRNLEENSSRLSVSQSTQEARTRELEGLLAELTLRHEKLASEEKTVAESITQRMDEAITPLREQLQQLDLSVSEEGGRHKEVDRRLQELGNRIGDISGRFNHLSLDVTDQREHREQLKQELIPRLQKLEAQNADIPSLETQLGVALKKETDALWQKLEEKDKDIVHLRERLEGLAESTRNPELDQKLIGVEAKVNRLSETENFLQESFQGLGGLELNITSRLEDLQRQLLEHIERNSEYEEALQRLSGRFGDISSNLQLQLEHAEQRQLEKIEALAQKQELFAERELNSESRRQDLDGQLDRIEESFTAERERLSQLEENFIQTEDKNEALRLELEQERLLQQELQSRLDDLNEDIAGHNNTLTARMAEQDAQHHTLAESVKEQAKKQQTLTDKFDQQVRDQQALSERIGGHLEQQSVLQTEAESVRQTLSTLEQRTQQSASQFNTIEQEQNAFRQQLEAEKPRIEEHSQTLQALANSFNTLEAGMEAQTQRIESIESGGKNNRIALIALLLLGLLGGLALFFSNVGRIAESEQQLAEKMISPDPRYITRDDLAAKMNALESGLAGNSDRISEVKAALPPQSLWERQIELEQQLARFEVRLNLLSAGVQKSSASEESGSQAHPKELGLIQREVERINAALVQLTTQPHSPSGEASLASVEQRLSRKVENLGVRISQLEASKPEPELNPTAGVEQRMSETSNQLSAHIEQLKKQQNSILKIERELSDTGKVFAERLNALETDSRDAKETLKQLQNQLHVLAIPDKEPHQSALSTSDRNDSTADWQAAADAHLYAIQLAGSRNESSLVAFASAQSLKRDTAYFRTVHEGRDWYILLYGPYSGFREASNTLKNLPSPLNRYNPWIRRIPSEAELVHR